MVQSREYGRRICSGNQRTVKATIPVQHTEKSDLRNILFPTDKELREGKGISVTIKVDNVNLNFLHQSTLQLFLEILY